MSKYIESEWLSKLFPDTGEGEWTYNATALGYIDSAPTIDIVRCGECKYASHWQTLGICAVTKQRIKADDFCSYGNCSEKPNNCEHITEDGVTCAKYPACDDCLDNPLNKVKGSERLVKGSERSSE